jgi:hypothetical protein
MKKKNREVEEGREGGEGFVRNLSFSILNLRYSGMDGRKRGVIVYPLLSLIRLIRLRG